MHHGVIIAVGRSVAVAVLEKGSRMVELEEREKKVKLTFPYLWKYSNIMSWAQSYNKEQSSYAARKIILYIQGVYKFDA